MPINRVESKEQERDVSSARHWSQRIPSANSRGKLFIHQRHIDWREEGNCLSILIGSSVYQMRRLKVNADHSDKRALSKTNARVCIKAYWHPKVHAWLQERKPCRTWLINVDIVFAINSLKSTLLLSTSLNSLLPKTCAREKRWLFSKRILMSKFCQNLKESFWSRITSHVCTFNSIAK